MNVEVARHKSTCLNPASSPERKASALAELTEIADGSDPKSLDAQLVLRELGHEAVSTGSVQPEPKAEVKPSSLDPREDVWHPDHFFWLFDKQAAEEQAFLEKAKADGLSHAETVAELRRKNGVHAARPYGVIANHADMCKQQGPYAAKTWFLPLIHQELQKLPAYDWPARELATETIAAYPEFDPDKHICNWGDSKI